MNGESYNGASLISNLDHKYMERGRDDVDEALKSMAAAWRLRWR
jgi:hypothetical protein